MRVKFIPYMDLMGIDVCEVRWFFFYQPSCANESCISQGYITGDNLPRYQLHLHISPRNKTVTRHFFYISPTFFEPIQNPKNQSKYTPKSRAFIHFGDHSGWGVSQPTRPRRWKRLPGEASDEWEDGARRAHRGVTQLPPTRKLKETSDGWKIARFFSREINTSSNGMKRSGISIVRVDLFVKGQHDKWARYFRWCPFHSTEIGVLKDLVKDPGKAIYVWPFIGGQRELH